MTYIFYIAAIVAILATLLVITRHNAVHALLYLIVSLLAIAVVFFTLGAPFVAALEVIIYAGAIMVLFIFVIMMLGLGPETVAQERNWLPMRAWIGPSLLAIVLLAEVAYVIIRAHIRGASVLAVDPHLVGRALFTTYALGVELSSLLLLAGLVGAYHLGRRLPLDEPGEGEEP